MRLYFLKNNNKRRRKIISLFFVVFIFVFTNIFSNYSYVSAAFNKQINYQGKLTDGSNMAVANGTYNMEFKLYTSSGSNIWTETRTGGNRVQVTNGLFSVMLGEVSSLSGVDFNQTLTLGVNIGGLSASPSWDGEMTPRKSLGTVPSAVVSETVTNAAQPAITSVGTLTGLTMGGNLQVGGHTLQFDNTGVRSWSMGVNALNLNISSGDGLGGLTFNNNTVWHAGNDGTGSTLDADLLDGHDTSYFQTALTNPTTGTGTANYLTKFTGATTLASSLIYDNGTRIGISTNNPSALLDVNGSSLFRNTLSVADTATRAYSNFGSNSTSHGLSNPADVLFSGNVEIDGNLYLDASTIQLSSTSISSDLQVDGVLKLSDGTALNPSYTFKNDTDTGLFRGGTNILGLTTAGAERMRIDADGNVGIGTTSPVTKAHITGTLTVDPGSGSNYSEGIRIASASDGYSVVNFGSNPTSGTGWQSNQWWIGKDGRDNGFNIFSGAGYDVFHINNSGNVGIGTTTPGYKLDVNGSINIGNLASGSDAILHFSSNAAGGTRRITYRAATAAISIDDTGGSALMTILNNGNVGIGTTSPGTKLDVSGGAIRTDNQLISTVATGTSPLSVSSSTLVSNLNADLLDGLHASGSVGANTIVTRDSNGYIYANYINSNVGYENSSAASYFYETGDGYLRKKSLANVRAELGGSSSGLNADLLDGLSSADFIQTSTDQSRSGKLQLYATDTSGSYHTRAIELREVGLSITAHSGDQNYAPALGFHWGGVNQAILSMHSNGQFYMTNDGVSGGTGLSTLNANIVASSVTVNGNSVWHAGNDGAGSGLDADLLDGINLGSISNNNGNIWGTIPVVKGDGVTEIGKYLDFHNASNDGIDYNNRITSNDGYLNLSGGLVISGAVTGAGESLKLGGIRGSYTNDYIHMYNKVGIGDPTGWGNGESSTPDKGLSVYGGANLAIGQGNVGIGTTSPKGKLHIVNNSVVNEENTGGINISSGVASTNAKLILGAVGDSYSYLQSMQQDMNWGTRPLILQPNSGNVGIGNLSPDTKLNVSGTTKSYSFAQDTNGLKIVSPGGASFATSAGSITGAIKIKLPAYRTSTMMRMKVNIYQYTTDQSYTIELGGYNYGDGGWYNTFANVTTGTGNNLNVRFGNDGVNNIIWIGELNSTWSYPQVFVTDFQAGYSNFGVDTWDDGWNVSFSTTFDSVEATTQGAYTWNNANLPNPLTGTGTANYLPKFTGTSSIGNSLIYDNGTNVGIGTTSPGATLDIQNNANAWATRGIRLLGPNMTAGSSLFVTVGKADSAYNMGQMYFYQAGDNSTSNRLSFGLHSVDNVLNILGTGNVGIGTTAPGYKLDVSGVANFNPGVFGDPSFESGYRLKLRDYGGTYNDAGMGIESDNGKMWFNNVAGGGYYFNDGTNGAKVTILGTSGNVGIGTTNPNGKLQIVTGPSSGLIIDNSMPTTPHLRIDGANNLVVDSGSDGGNLYLNYDSNKNVIFGSGNVGIGTTSPGANLDVKSSGMYWGSGSGSATLLVQDDTGRGTMRLRSASDDSTDFLFDVNGATRWDLATRNSSEGYSLQLYSAAASPSYTSLGASVLTILQSGNVGIGTTTPVAKLDVNGTTRMERHVGINSLVLNTFATVNPASNVFLYSQPNDRDSWIYLDSADTGSNWGIYHRQIDSAVSNLPANSIGFVGGGSSALQSYISLADGSAYFKGNVGIGTTSPGAKLDVAGDIKSNNVLITPGDGYGLCFWSDCFNYKISMGNGAQYNYGPVGTSNYSYSIKTTMASNSGWGFTWGAPGVTPIAGLEVTTGNMQIAGSMTASSFSGNGANLTNVNADMLDGYSLENIMYYHSSRDFANGTLIQTSIDYSNSDGDPWILEIKGNSYGSLIPFDIQYQGYIYANTVINDGGISNGTNLTGLVVFNYNGKLTFWFPRQTYWQGFNVNVYTAYGTYAKNKVTSITDSAKPGSITKEVELSSKIRQSWHSGNLPNPLTGTGTTNYIPKFTGTSSIGNSLIYDNGTNVGIGTASPNSGYKLDLAGNLYIQGSYLDFSSLTPSFRVIGQGTFSIGDDDNVGLSSNRLYVKNDGNVGIGTTSPSAKLDVSAGNIDLDNTTSANQYGAISKNGEVFLHDFNYGYNGSVTTGGRNTFLGISSGNFTMGSTATANTQSSYNTAVGAWTLTSNTLGSENSAFGFNSLNLNTTGFNNTANGSSSLSSNTSGSYNSAFGYRSLALNSTPSNNTAVGSYTLSAQTGGFGNNTAIGYNALGNITSSYNNTALGASAGSYISGGTNNTSSTESLFLGYDTRPLNNGGSNEIVIGANATGLGSNTVVLGNSSIVTTALRGNVGVGTTSPSRNLDVVGSFGVNVGNSFTYNTYINYTWTARTSSGGRYWTDITSSSDGTKLAATVGYSGVGYIYTSTDSGASWTERTSPGQRNWYGIASSSDGTKLVAVVNGGYVYTSTDSGVSWTERTSSGFRYWKMVTSSADGVKLVAVGDNYIYYSTDSGATWTVSDAGYKSWASITSSSDGSKIFAGSENGNISYSVNSGVNWTSYGTSGLTYTVAGIGVSGNGSKVFATDGYTVVGYNFSTYLSTYTSLGGYSGDYFRDIVVSSDGAIIHAAMLYPSGYDVMYSSTNGGASWGFSQISSSYVYGSYPKMAASADCTKIALVPSYNSQFYIYTGVSGTASSSGGLLVTSSGMVGIGNSSPSHLIHLAGGAYSDGSTWTNASDVNLKENFTELDPNVVLEKIGGLDIKKWNYKIDNPSVVHFGPTAQDFYKAFALGGSDTSISTIDSEGVALAGIKGLYNLINVKLADNSIIKDTENTDTTEDESILEKISSIKIHLNKSIDTNARELSFDTTSVENTLPELVKTDIDTKVKTINYSSLTPYLVKSIQEMNLMMTDINTFKPEDIEADTNPWRKALTAWLGNATNRITRIFTGEICLTDTDGQTECINRSELKSIKALIGTSNTATVVNSTTPSTSTGSSTTTGETGTTGTTETGAATETSSTTPTTPTTTTPSTTTEAPATPATPATTETPSTTTETPAASTESSATVSTE